MPLSSFEGTANLNSSAASVQDIIKNSSCRVRVDNKAVLFCENGFIGVTDAENLFGVWGPQVATLNSSIIQDKGQRAHLDFSVNVSSSKHEVINDV